MNVWCDCWIDGLFQVLRDSCSAENSVDASRNCSRHWLRHDKASWDVRFCQIGSFHILPQGKECSCKVALAVIQRQVSVVAAFVFQMQTSTAVL